jgi:DNA mismatch repair protein MutS2
LKTSDILEFNKVKQLLADRTVSQLAREDALSLFYTGEISLVRERLAETSEAVHVILRKGRLPMGDFGDIRKAVIHAEKGGVLTFAELLDVARHLEICASVQKYLSSDMPEIPHIRDIVSVIESVESLALRIHRTIISETEMADTASTALKSIRRNIALQNEQIRERLNRIVTSNAYKDMLQDQLITLRDGRYCVPVKQAYRARFSGIIHDQSKGGATLFIEPQAVVEANNKLRELEMEEEKEIQRILAAFSAEVGAYAHNMRLNQDMLTKLDFIFAKGQLACDMDAVLPKLNENRILRIKAGRHPLIDPEKVVPISLDLGERFSVMVITGPNTGGKTVTLKTVGLFLLMAQAGLHLPADSVEIPLMRRVCADIGDEQSIEQSLSTFSSHMRNLVEIFADSDSDSIVLLDELGAGTDPTEGAALAIAILEAFQARGCLVLATTHYTELKKYAIASEGVENASMEFDLETLSPTFRLIVGTPGRSNAFEISAKLGLGEEIIARAREQMDEGSLAFENVIGQVEADRISAQSDRTAAAELLEDVKKRESAFEERLEAFEGQREKILEKTKEKAQEKIEEVEEYTQIVREELKALLDDAREMAAHKEGESTASRGGFYHLLDENRKMLSALKDDYARVDGEKGKAKKQAVQSVKPKDFTPGQCVRLLHSDQEGEVITAPNSKGQVQVLVGSMKLFTAVSNLSMIEKKTSKVDNKKFGGTAGGFLRSKTESVSTSINVIGEDLDTAKMLVEKYLDDAVLAGLHEVSVVHGRGEGILRDGLRRMFRAHRNVEAVRPGGPGEGGDGATIVRLKK